MFFAPIADELDEISNLKKHQSPLDKKMSEFVSSEVLKQEIESSIKNYLIIKILLRLKDPQN